MMEDQIGGQLYFTLGDRRRLVVMVVLVAGNCSAELARPPP